MRKYKLSRFNHVSTKPDGNVLIHNGMSGNMVSMSSEEWQNIKSSVQGGSIIESSSLTDYETAGIIVDQAKDESATLKNAHLAARYNSSNWMPTICPTIFCNFKCDYCFELHRPGKMSVSD